MTDRELMQQALEALEEIADEVFSPYDNKLGDAILALRAALAEPEQEPVAYIEHHKGGDNLVWDDPGGKRSPLYTAPPQRKPLTDEELRVIENKINPNMRWRSSDEEGITLYPIEYYELVRAIEAAHGIKE